MTVDGNGDMVNGDASRDTPVDDDDDRDGENNEVSSNKDDLRSDLDSRNAEAAATDRCLANTAEDDTGDDSTGVFFFSSARSML
jgi:hypothetical protein